MTSSNPDGTDTTEADVELERLQQLRRDVATGLLAVSKSAKRDADALLAADQRTAGAPWSHASVLAGAPEKAWMAGIFGAGLVCGWLVAVIVTPSDDTPIPPTTSSEATAPPVETTGAAPAPRVPTPVEPPGAEPAPASIPDRPSPPPATDGLVLTIRATGPCWISVEIDGSGTPVERLLSPNDEFVVEAQTEAALRLGDPAAVSMSINGLPTRALGVAGRAVSLRITRDNFQALLAN